MEVLAFKDYVTIGGLIAGAGVVVWRVGALEKGIKEFQTTFVPREVFNLTVDLLKLQIEQLRKEKS